MSSACSFMIFSKSAHTSLWPAPDRGRAFLASPKSPLVSFQWLPSEGGFLSWPLTIEVNFPPHLWTLLNAHRWVGWFVSISSHLSLCLQYIHLQHCGQLCAIRSSCCLVFYRVNTLLFIYPALRTSNCFQLFLSFIFISLKIWVIMDMSAADILTCVFYCA